MFISSLFQVRVAELGRCGLKPGLAIVLVEQGRLIDHAGDMAECAEIKRLAKEEREKLISKREKYKYVKYFLLAMLVYCVASILGELLRIAVFGK